MFPPIEQGYTEIDEKNEHEQDNACGDQCFPVQISGIAHFQYNIGGHSADTAEESLSLIHI